MEVNLDGVCASWSQGSLNEGTDAMEKEFLLAQDVKLGSFGRGDENIK